MLAKLTILAIFMQITSLEMGLACWRMANLAILVIFIQITSPEMGLTGVGKFGDFYDIIHEAESNV